jgi:hypothetical protein
MKKAIVGRFLVGFLASTAAVGLSCRATIVFDYSAAYVNQTAPYILGNAFQVNSPITVTAVGVYASAYTTATSLPVGIYKNTDGTWNQVAGTFENVPITSAAEAGTLWVSLPNPVTLGAGVYSIEAIVQQDYNAGIVPGWPWPPSVVTFDTFGGALTLYPACNWQQTGFPASLPSNLNGFDWWFQNNNDPPVPFPVFAAGNFQVAPVPEPTTIVAGALLLLPFGASAVRSLRKRQKA